MLAILLNFCIGNLLLGTCTLLASPCVYQNKQVSCHGPKVTDQLLSKFFLDLSSRLPDHEKELTSFELSNSSVHFLTAKTFSNITINSYIKLRNNNLQHFSIGNFDRLFLLDLSNNVLPNIDPNISFIGLNQLEVIHLASVGLRNIQKEYFTHLKNLKRLDLNNNEIEHLDIDAFTSEYDNNFELRQIDLSYNKIRHLPANIFRVLRQPELINLANNQLDRVDEIFHFNRDIVQFEPIKIVLANNSLKNEHFTNGTLEFLVSRGHYVELDLSYNKLVWLDESVFGKLLHDESKSVLKLDHNPIQCTNCRNRWLFQRQQQQPTFLNSISLRTCIEKKRDLKMFTLADFSHCN